MSLILKVFVVFNISVGSSGHVKDVDLNKKKQIFYIIDFTLIGDEKFLTI